MRHEQLPTLNLQTIDTILCNMYQTSISANTKTKKWSVLHETIMAGNIESSNHKNNGRYHMRHQCLPTSNLQCINRIICVIYESSDL